MRGATRKLGVAHLTALDLPPLALVRAAARAGFGAVGLRTHPALPGGLSYPTRPGTRDHMLLRAALREEGLRVSEVELVQLAPGLDLADLLEMLESGADLGAAAINVTGDDPDPARMADCLARVGELAGGFGMRVDVEFMRWRHVATYADALALVRSAGLPNLGILVDALHLDRSGGAPKEVLAAPGGPVHAIQLSDAPKPRPKSHAEAIHEAREARLLPGQGGLPLLDLLRQVGPAVAISAEVPQERLSPAERLSTAYRATSDIIEAAFQVV